MQLKLFIFAKLCRLRRLAVFNSGRAETPKSQSLSGAYEDGLRLSADEERGSADAAN